MLGTPYYGAMGSCMKWSDKAKEGGRIRVLFKTPKEPFFEPLKQKQIVSDITFYHNFLIVLMVKLGIM